MIRTISHINSNQISNAIDFIELTRQMKKKYFMHLSVGTHKQTN